MQMKVILLLGAGLLRVHAFPFAAPIGADSPRRFLLLHGSGTTAGAFVNSPTARGAKEFLTGVPRRVDTGILIPPNWIYSALDAGFADGWWEGDDKFKNVDKSIAEVEAAIEEQQAAGIIGHEQGATLAALVAARSALGEGVPLKFAVMCGATMPTEGSAPAALLERLRSTPSASIPTLHCISKSDTVTPPELSEELARCFDGKVIWHDRGVAMPGRSWWEESEGFPEYCIGGGPWPCW